MFSSIGTSVEWYGAMAVLVAYGLALFQIIPFMGGTFAILTILGAITVILGSILNQNFQWVVFYIIWGAMTAFVYFNPFHLKF